MRGLEKSFRLPLRSFPLWFLHPFRLTTLRRAALTQSPPALRIKCKEYMAMVRGKYLLIAFVLASVGLWGCNQAGNTGGQAERIRSLEAKVAKLEDDYRAAATVRDQARKNAQPLEEEL